MEATLSRTESGGPLVAQILDGVFGHDAPSQCALWQAPAVVGLQLAAVGALYDTWLADLRFLNGLVKFERLSANS
jgi:hypothetical protein